MAHPLVDQLRFTRSEWLRALDGVPEEDGFRRFEPMNSIGWTVAHLAWQEQRNFLTRPQGLTPVPILNEVAPNGGPATTPSLTEMLAAWKQVTDAPTIRGWTRSTPTALVQPLPGTPPRTVGDAIHRTLYHYWFHAGEIMAMRQLLDHPNRPEFVGPGLETQGALPARVPRRPAARARRRQHGKPTTEARATMQPFRLMVGYRGMPDRDTLLDQARRAESVGFTHVAIHDHLTPQLAPIPLLTAVGMVTERLGLVPLVFNNDLRHPAVLAQELATLDRLSNGRADGRPRRRLERAGIRLDRHALRPARDADRADVRGGDGHQGPVRARSHSRFHGRFYDIENLDGQPKPLQQPHPPFLVGGTREHVLRLAARTAQVVGMDLRQNREQIADAFPARMDERVGWIRDEAGERFDELELSVLRLLGPITITNHARQAADDVARAYTRNTGLEVSAVDLLGSPYSMVGSIRELATKLREARERWGINSYLLGWFDEPEIWDLAPLVEQLAGT